MRIAVVGATGRVGHHAVDVLHEQGNEVVPISRAQGVDVITGVGLDMALDGVEVIIDAATGPSPDEREATDFFTTATRNLQRTGARAGLRRLVVVSIIGIDKARGGYNRAKLAHEEAAQAGPAPAKIVRAAQFHEFVEQLVGWGRQGDVAYLPKMRTQLVAARTVAEALVDVATTDAEIREVAGPQEENLAAMARLLAAKRGAPREILEVSDPDNPDREFFEDGTLLPGAGAVLGGPTYAEWLETTSE